MKEGTKNALKCVGAGTGGAAAGAGLYAVIGGIGLAVGGTAVGITVGPFIAIGAGAGVLLYGFFWLGQQSVGPKSPPDRK